MYRGPLRQRLVLGRGMLSDNTEHACMTAQALLAAGDDPGRFAHALARKLRWWLLGLPAAIGLGTLRALVRSWIGFSPARSGVRSAGNGAVMRAPILGAWFEDPDRLAAFVAASTAIPHRARTPAPWRSRSPPATPCGAVRSTPAPCSTRSGRARPTASCSARSTAWRTRWSTMPSLPRWPPSSAWRAA